MNYFNKYIKYKNKYKRIKGGAVTPLEPVLFNGSWYELPATILNQNSEEYLQRGHTLSAIKLDNKLYVSYETKIALELEDKPITFQPVNTAELGPRQIKTAEFIGQWCKLDAKILNQDNSEYLQRGHTLSAINFEDALWIPCLENIT